MKGPPLYDPEHISNYFDAYGEREWMRLERTASDRVNFHIHHHVLKQYLKAGQEILEIGPGPGRFTIPMAEAGAYVTVVDISKRQLELNQERVSAAGLEAHVLARHQLDIVDLAGLPDDHFDLTIAYGGPVSYVFDKAPLAIAELLRVTKPGGYVLFSVMSKWGSTRKLLPPIIELIDHYGIKTIGEVLHSGDVHYQLRSEHRFHMYDSMELLEMLSEIDCELVELRSSGVLAVQNDVELEGKWHDASFWPKFLEWELEASRQPGALDAGTHIIAVLRKSQYR